MIRITTSGDNKKTSRSLEKILRGDIYSELDRYGKQGVDLLSSATPISTGLTASSWGYRIKKGKRIGIEWFNTNAVNGVSVAILIQYGHATGTGGYVQGRDFINPAIRPLFDQIADEIWKKVTSG